MIIKNRFSLLNGKAPGRSIVLDVVERTLEEVNYYNLIRKVAVLDDGILKVKGKTFSIKGFEKVYFVAGGKGSSHMARAFQEILGERISEGLVVEKKGYPSPKLRLPILYAGHPLPDEESVEAGRKVIELAGRAGRRDLLIICVSGGWTSLTACPPQPLSLEDVVETYRLLLFSGMPLSKMNIVRNRLSMLGKGKILKHVNGASVLGLIAVDEVGGQPWGPTVPDDTGFEDAVKVLEEYGLMERIPKSVKNYILENFSKERDGLIAGEVKEARVENIVLVNNIDLCNIALKHASSHLPSHVLTTSIEGEAKDVGAALSSIAREILSYNRPFSRPCILIAGGETTVTIGGECGEGGRNQELALSAALSISGTKIVLASIATDGTDGPTDVAGAIVDGETYSRIVESGLNPIKELKSHNSSHVFKTLGDAVYAEDTGTNLMDLIVVYIP